MNLRVLVATSHPTGSNVAHAKFLQCLEAQTAPCPGGLEWVTQSARADAVLLIDNDYLGPDRFFSRIVRGPLLRQFAGRCFLFSNTDWPAPYFPGIFPSLTPQDVRGGRACSSHYLSTAIPLIPIQYIEDGQRDWLYSFVGRVSTSPVRLALMRLDDARGHCAGVSGAPEQQADLETYRHRYWTTLARSHFALCPRGYGASSFRLFEAMQCGRAPVIIADDWVPPAGPDWDTFSIRIRQDQIMDIPEILTALEHRSHDMGRLARAAWEQWFSDHSTPHTFARYLQGLIPHAGTGSDAIWSLRYLAGSRQLRWMSARLMQRQT